MEFPDLKRRIVTEAKRHETNLVLIEEAGSGVQLIQSLKKETGLKVVGVQPKDDKATRLLAVSPMIEAGRIAIPSEAIWLADYQREMTLFPNGKHDDQVDSTTQFLKWHDRPKYRSGVVRLKL